MNIRSLMLADPPELDDKTAVEMLDFLYELTTAFENHYAHQIRRFDPDPHNEWFQEFLDNEDPPF